LRENFFLALFALLANLSEVSAARPCAAVEKKPYLIEEPAQDPSNGLPNVSSRFKPDSTNFAVFADLLIWCAQESGTENWAEVITGGNGSPENCSIESVDFDWNAGLRIGFGYGMKHDQWDSQLYYTWFRTRGTDHVSSVPGSVFSAYLGNFYVDNPNGEGIKGLSYQKASIDWTIHFNIFDWELGRAFWVSKALSLRPFLGLKGGWIHQSIHTKWHNPSPPTPPLVLIPFNTGREDLKNDFWGIGPSGGISTKWNVLALQNHSFSFLGDFSGAVMYGHWALEDEYRNDIGQEVDVKVADINGGATMVRTFLGFGWEGDFSNGGLRFSTKAGYEMQFWLDQIQLYIFDTGRLNNELTLQGATLEFRFEF